MNKARILLDLIDESRSKIEDDPVHKHYKSHGFQYRGYEKGEHDYFRDDNSTRFHHVLYNPKTQQIVHNVVKVDGRKHTDRKIKIHPQDLSKSSNHPDNL